MGFLTVNSRRLLSRRTLSGLTAATRAAARPRRGDRTAGSCSIGPGEYITWSDTLSPTLSLPSDAGRPKATVIRFPNVTALASSSEDVARGAGGRTGFPLTHHLASRCRSAQVRTFAHTSITNCPSSSVSVRPRGASPSFSGSAVPW